MKTQGQMMKMIDGLINCTDVSSEMGSEETMDE